MLRELTPEGHWGVFDHDWLLDVGERLDGAYSDRGEPARDGNLLLGGYDLATPADPHYNLMGQSVDRVFTESDRLSTERRQANLRAGLLEQYLGARNRHEATST